MGAPGSRTEQPSPGGVSPWRLVMVAFLILALGLVFAREIPAELGLPSDLGNLVPLASLFGLGLGCMRQGRRSLAWLLPGGLGLVFLLLVVSRGTVLDEAPQGLLFLLNSGRLPVPLHRLPLLGEAAAIFLCVATAFVALGQDLTREMGRAPHLVALGRVLIGGLAATAAHAFTLPLRLPPWALVSGIAVLAVLVVARGRWERGALLAAGLAFLLFSRSPVPGQWSPYALVQILPTPEGGVILSNTRFHDLVLDVPGDPEASRKDEELALARWGRPLRLFREIHGRGPESVLVLGSGAGNDVALALDEGVLRVVAVELDPVILEVGRRLNFSAPYSDPRVEAVVGDPRLFLRSSRETFDVIVFGTLVPRAVPGDETLLPHRSFVYTREAFEDARQHLARGGLLAVHSPDDEGSLSRHLCQTLRSVFGDRCRMIGESVPAPLGATLVASRDLDLSASALGTGVRPGGGPVTTDDWPYPGAERPAVETMHLRVLGVAAVLVLGALLLLHRAHPVDGLHLDYLLLGMGSGMLAFLASARLDLVLGRGWLVATVALFLALLVLLLANSLVLRRRAASPALAWAGLVGMVLANALVPVVLLGAVGVPGRAAVVALLLGVPVLCVGLCFSDLLSGEPIVGPPLGVTLVGGMAGGLLEHASILIGMRAAWLLVAVILALAWLAALLLHRAPASSGSPP